MAIALVASTVKQSAAGNAITTDAIDTTGATLLVVGVGHLSGTSAGGPTDSKSNSWTAGATAAGGGVVRISMFHCVNPTVGSGHTFTAGGTGNFPVVLVVAFSGTDTSAARDQENSAGTSGGTTIQPGSVTPSVDNEVLVTAMGQDTVGNTMSIDSGFTITNQMTIVGGVAFGGSMAYLVQGSAAATNPTWTESPTTGGDRAAGIDTFKAAAAATGWGPLVGLQNNRLVVAEP